MERISDEDLCLKIVDAVTELNHWLRVAATTTLEVELRDMEIASVGVPPYKIYEAKIVKVLAGG